MELRKRAVARVCEEWKTEEPTMWKTPKILVIEDEPRLRRCMCRELREEGLMAIEACDGEEAIEMMRREGDVDLVLLDIILPGESSLVVYDLIRKEYPQVNIIIASTYSREQQEFLFWDADGYYNKGESIEQLIHETNRLLIV